MGGYSQKTSHIYWNTGIEFKYDYNFFEFLFETNEMTKVPVSLRFKIVRCFKKQNIETNYIPMNEG